MVDKVRPFKWEEIAGGGGQNDVNQTELNPAQDYVAGKGFSFENSDDYLAEKIGRLLGFKIPDGSQKPTYLGNGDLDYLEIFATATQTTGNRLAKITIGYDGSLNPITETTLIYDTDGTTVLRTVTTTISYSGADFSNAAEVTT